MGNEMRIAQIANNLANVNTSGYKQDRAVFLDLLQSQMAAAGVDPSDPAAANAANPAAEGLTVLGNSYVDTSAGALQPTGRSLDLAIEGEGFFQVEVEGENDPFYTRAGSFLINENNELVTNTGHQVLDRSGGPIRLELNGVEPEITADGDILVNGGSVAKIGIVTFDTPHRLEKYGEGLLRAPADLNPQSVEHPQVRQRMLEGSNVNAIDEMIRMIQTQRAYESQQKAMQSIFEVVGRRIDEALR